MRPIHFHVIPIYDWVEELFWKDARYRPLGGSQMLSMEKEEVGDLAVG